MNTASGKPKSKKSLFSLVGSLLLVASVSVLLLAPRPAKALGADVIGGPSQVISTVYDKYIKPALDWAWKHGAAVAFKNALRTFTTKIAYDTAVLLSTAGQGQTPLVQTKPLGKIISDAADDAAGDFLDSLVNAEEKLRWDVDGDGTGDTDQALCARQGLVCDQTVDPKCPQNGAKCQLTKSMLGSYVNLGVCSPVSLSARLSIGLSLFNEAQPRQPRCSLSQMIKNWENFVADPKNILTNFGAAFDPMQNDLGIALHLSQTLVTHQGAQADIAETEADINKGFKNLTESITGFIKTPAESLRAESEKQKDVALQNFGQFTGDIVADALGVFTNTLASRLMKRLFTKGLIENPSQNLSTSFSFGASGVEYASQVYSDISVPQLVGLSNTLDIISEYSSCPTDPATYAPVNSCTITQGFDQALRKAEEGSPLTVQEAINQGFIEGSLRFALIRPSDDLQAPTKAWYLSDIRKLRRARIVPTGWEIAAEKFAGTPYTLQRIMGTPPYYYDGFNSAGPDGVCNTGDDNPKAVLGNINVCGLIDPNWVLRAPPAQCRLEAYGQIPEPQGSNRQKTCVDLRHCVAEKADGSCQAWGYCTREQNIWRFAGQSCEFPEASGVSPWGTCQSYTNPAGQVNNYLANSLANYDDGICTDGAGCQWYSAARNPDATLENLTDDYLIAGTQENVNTVDFHLAEAVANPVFYFKNVKNKPCTTREEGCTEFLQLSHINTTALYGNTDPPPFAQQVQDVVASVTDNNVLTPPTYESLATVTSVYLRQAPAYLNCYDASTTNDAPECANYLKLCYEDEVGCELYTPQDGSPAVPGKVEPANTCPAECNGFNIYTQVSAFFENYKLRNQAEPEVKFIPATAQTCSAAYVGCEEFTNVEQNETKEYYTELRQCVRPEDNVDNTYYTWVGSDLTGYQLKIWQLEATTPDDPLSAPATTDGSLDCRSANSSDPDCKEFYATDGSQIVVHYRYESKVRYSSSSCYRYRRSGGTPDDCAYSGGSWENGFCFYRAIPAQGKLCSPAAVGCREFKGPTAGNIRLVFPVSTFGDVERGVNADASPLSGWTGGTNSTESTSAFGHSLASGNNRSIRHDITGQVTTGKQYILTFWAKIDNNTPLTGVWKNPLANLFGGSEAAAQSSYVWDLGAFTPTNDGEWHIFNLGPATLTYDVSNGGQILLQISGTANFFIDNIAFREVQDTFYVRKNTWVTPATCLEPQHLRCSAYNTRGGQTTYLTGFSAICRNEAVGCQALVDTHNSSAAKALEVAADDQTVVVPADQAVFRVYDPKKACSAEFAGCKRLGQPMMTATGALSSWTDVFTVLKPDIFDPALNGANSPLCSFAQNRCQVYTDSSGVRHYFKDPQGKVCEYKIIDQATGYEWYKQGTNEPCNLVVNSSFEQLLADSLSGTPDDETADVFTGWRPVSSAGSLYAVSSFNGQYWGSNVVRVNPSAGGVIQSPGISFATPAQRLLAVYVRVRIPSATTAGTINLHTDCNTVGSRCTYIGGSNTITIDTDTPRNQWLMLYQAVRTLANTNEVIISVTAPGVNREIYIDQVEAVVLDASLSDELAIEQASIPYAYTCPANQVGCTAFRDPELTRKTYYYLNNERLEKGLCNGQVSEKEGCILFNDLSQSTNFVSSGWHAFDTYAASRAKSNILVAPVKATPPALNNTNLVLKVRRDRICAEWLACKSESPRFNPQTNRYDTICYALGTCNQIGGGEESGGRCASWVQKPAVPLNISIYQAKGVDWSSLEYSGYALPNIYPVELLTQKEYGELRCGGTTAGEVCYVPGSTAPPCSSTLTCQLVKSDIRLTYLSKTEASCGGLPSDPACLKESIGQVCGNGKICQYKDFGLNGNGPGEKLENAEPKLCRAYPQADAPFPESIVATYAQPCDPATPGCPASSFKLPSIKQAGYKDVNACQEGEVCECSYNRAIYNNGNNVFFSLETQPPALYPTDATEAGENQYQVTYARLKNQDLNIGMKGFCLEKDTSRYINNGRDRVCLTWLPLDVVNGEISIYDYAPEAGYTGGSTYYCSRALGVLPYVNYIRPAGRTMTLWYQAPNGLLCGSTNTEGDCVDASACGRTPEYGERICLSNRHAANYLCVGGICYYNYISCEDCVVTGTVDNDVYIKLTLSPDDIARGGMAAIEAIDLQTLWGDGMRLTRNVPHNRVDHATNEVYTEAWVDWSVNNTSTPFITVRIVHQHERSTHFGIKILFIQRELCAETVQTALNNQNKAWTDRVLRLTTTPFAGREATELGFTSSRRQSPYGKMSFPPSGGELLVVADDYFNANSDRNYRTITTPFACSAGRCGLAAGSTKPGTCIWPPTKIGTACQSSEECRDTNTGQSGVCTGYFSGTCSNDSSLNCINDRDCGAGNSCGSYRSMGLTIPPTNGRERVLQIFAKEYGVQSFNNSGNWQAEPSASYVDRSCGVGTIPCQNGFAGYPNTLAPGVPAAPRVRPVLFDAFGKSIGESSKLGFTLLANNSYQDEGNVRITTNDAVTAIFYVYNPNGEQMPLRKVFVDWGDGTSLSGASGAFKNHKFKCAEPPANWGDDPKACVDEEGARIGYFAFTHVYDCQEPDGECSYQPRVFVEDNWEWCAADGWKCNPQSPPDKLGRGWVPYGRASDRVIVRGISGATANAGPLAVAPPTDAKSCGNIGGPFSPPSHAFVITNTGSAAMNWTVSDNVDWLSYTPSSSGVLGPGASIVVTASVNIQANNLEAGTYAAQINFVNETNGVGNTVRNYSLQVVPVGRTCTTISSGS